MTIAELPAVATPLVEIVVAEELDVSSVPRVRERLEDALRLRPGRLVVDLGRCGFLDGSGLAALLAVHRQAMRQGAEFVLRAPDARVRRLIALTGLAKVFTVEPAVGSVAPA